LSFHSIVERKVQENDDWMAVDRLAAIGQIAAGIAHEVRNPLTAVKGFLQLLQKDQPHVYLDIACEELEKAINTIQNLLHVSKPDFADEQASPVRLSVELESTLFLFQNQMYDIQVVTDFQDTHVEIHAKRGRLKKAFFNLIKNAFEATQDGGTISIRHYIAQENLVVSIADTGIGIPKDKLAMLGTPFFTSKEAGTGLGLTQVYSTMHEHQAKIEVQSEVGLGTVFTIRFPLQTV